MLINREKRIKYLGFDDFWYFLGGIVATGLLTDYLFNNSFARLPSKDAFLSIIISIFFSACNWFIMRSFIINLRIRFPDFKDNGKRVGFILLTMFSTVLIIDLVGNFILANIFGDSFHPMSRTRILLPILLISGMIIAMYEAVYFYNRLKASVREEEQAKQIITQAKLDALRNQAQPHFLFNSLNTLRDIIDYDSKADAKQFVDKLADVYRFILVSGNENLIPLSKELKFSKSYIHIQSERFGENLKINWKVDSADLDFYLVPMSLQLLLENAIKHNVVSKSKPLVIDVITKDNQLIVENKIQSKSTQIPSTKLGLKNIEKRYALISSQAVQIHNDGHLFRVSIPLLKSIDQKNTHAHINH